MEPSLWGSCGRNIPVTIHSSWSRSVCLRILSLLYPAIDLLSGRPVILTRERLTSTLRLCRTRHGTRTLRSHLIWADTNQMLSHE